MRINDNKTFINVDWLILSMMLFFSPNLGYTEYIPCHGSFQKHTTIAISLLIMNGYSHSIIYDFYLISLTIYDWLRTLFISTFFLKQQLS